MVSHEVRLGVCHEAGHGVSHEVGHGPLCLGLVSTCHKVS